MTTLEHALNETASAADTPGTAISAAETRRVIACFFDVLAAPKYNTSDVFNILSAGMCRAYLRQRDQDEAAGIGGDQ